jgi:hypothetical protein
MEDQPLQGSLFGAPQVAITSDDYYTPKWIFDALKLRFAIDVSSPPDGPPYTPCDRYFTMADDGLAQPWNGLIWMNPPYSKSGPWVDKFLDHGNGLALLPTARSSWFYRLWESDAKVVCFNVLFERPGQTKPVSPGMFGSSLWAIGDEATTALRNANFGKVR